MADSQGIQDSCKEVADFLTKTGIKCDVVERFKSEKVDKSAILMMSDEQLSCLGVETIGDRLRLKAFCSPLTSSSTKAAGLSSDLERQEKIDRVKSILNENKRGKRSSTKESRGGPSKVRQKETLKFEFGWKHWSNGKYKQKRSDHGGGKRRIDVAREAGYDECLQMAKKLFFPKGVSSEGHEDEMYLSLANYAGDQVVDLEDGPDIVPFSAERYKDLTGFALPSVYLLSRSKQSVEDDNSDDEHLLKPVFESSRVEDTKELSEPSALIGSSSERKALFDNLERLVAESAAIDTAKQEAREAAEKERRAQMDEEIAKASEEVKELEELRMRRERRVPCEPTANGVVVSVRHIDLGVVTRRFPSSGTMCGVYDWIGSLSQTPKYFRLTKMPNIMLYPDVNVTEADKELLSMVEESVPLPLAADEHEVTFHEGEAWDDKLPPEETLMDISDEPLDMLLDGEEDAFQGSYTCLEARREREKHAIETKLEKVITVSRHNIMELMKIYEDPQITGQNLVVYFDEDSGSGDGVLREMFSVFWDRFLMLNCDGSFQFAIAVNPAMQPQDYITLGRILTHGFILCGSFPVQLARASLHQAFFGSASDECLVDSFMNLLPEKERETVAVALKGKQPFPSEEIIDIFADFKETTMPTSANLRNLILKIATAELVTKPFLPLLKLREGMGDFWNGLKREELDSLYQMCCPTPLGVARQLSSVTTSQLEEKVFTWLKRYARNMETKMAVKFVRFCTASDVLLPSKDIMVRFDNMPEEAIRPIARTCFRTLTVARNYRSFHHLKENFDFYLHDPTQWDLSD